MGRDALTKDDLERAAFAVGCWIEEYVGACPDDELDKMYKLKEKLYRLAESS